VILTIVIALLLIALGVGCLLMVTGGIVQQLAWGSIAIAIALMVSALVIVIWRLA
jgi:hypothetical protein